MLTTISIPEPPVPLYTSLATGMIGALMCNSRVCN